MTSRCVPVLQERARTEAEAWERQLQRVEAFCEQHGQLPRPQDSAAQPFAADEAELGRWCDTQRERKKGRGTSAPLSPTQVEALEALPGWWWEADPAAEWEAMQRQVADFAQQHGDLPRQKRAGVPAEEGQLGQWCATQRRRKRGTLTPPLSADQEAALAAVPHWDWGRGRKQLLQEDFEVPAAWAQQLRLVIAFQLRHVRLPGEATEQLRGQQQPPSEALEGEAELAAWCEEQQQCVEGPAHGHHLTPQQAAALSSLPGWRWRGGMPRVNQPAKLAAEWQVRLWQVAAFRRQHARLPKRPGSDSMERQLGKWCARQRQRRKGQGGYRELTPAQLAQLRSLEGWFWEEEEADEAAWERSLQHLAAFLRQHVRRPRKRGSQRAPLAEGERDAGVWINHQVRRLRGAKGYAPLPPERAAALAAVLELLK